MTHDPNCIFCKIVEGKIPSHKVYEGILPSTILQKMQSGSCAVIAAGGCR